MHWTTNMDPKIKDLELRHNPIIIRVNKFDEQSAFDEDVIDCGCFKVLLDSLSYPYLLGSELDYVEDLSGAKFVIRNPNAKTTCGCGESFSI